MLDFFKDVFSAFRQNSLERIKSPFLGAFVFSWLGFNWQMIAVLILSKQNIIDRLDYINKSYDAKDYVLAPLFTTALICVLLPLANKLVTKLQKKTNLETNQLILQSKIDIAEEQLKIADIEAKKKLAEEREKKNIEANIDSVLKERDSLQIEFDRVNHEKYDLSISYQKIKAELEVLKETNEKLENDLNKTRNELVKALDSSSKINSENDSMRKISAEVIYLREDRERLTKELTNLISEKGDVENNLKLSSDKLNSTVIDNEWLTTQMSALKSQRRGLVEPAMKLSQILYQSDIVHNPSMQNEAQGYINEILQVAESADARGATNPPHDFIEQRNR